MLDGPLLCGLVARPVCCLVKAEAFTPLVGPLLRRAGQIAVLRDALDPAPVRRCLHILWSGGVVGIFPEGTRGNGLVAHAKPGVGYLALRTGATVVPVACHGSERLGRALRPRVHVVVGAPLAFDTYPRGRPLNRQRAVEAAERVRAGLAGLVAATTHETDPATGTLAE
jgi:1-acyl-sn-glycerol-3-phosphate acyltransferase